MSGTPPTDPGRRRRGCRGGWWKAGLGLVALVVLGPLLAPALIGLFGLLITGTCLIAAWQAARRWRRVARTATSTLRGAAQGFVELTGSADRIDGAPFAAPITGRPAVVAEARLEVREGRKRGRGRTTYGWWTEWHAQQDDGALLFTDAEGRACGVFTATAAHWQGEQTWTVKGDTGRDALPAGVLARFPQLADGRRWRLREQVVAPGDPVFGIGEFRTLEATRFPFTQGTMERALAEIDRYTWLERLVLRGLARVTPAGTDAREVEARRAVWDRVAARVTATAPAGERTRVNWLMERPLVPGTPMITNGDERALLRALRRQGLLAGGLFVFSAVFFGAMAHALWVQ